MPRKIFYLDLLERLVWTFIQGFVAFWVMTGEVDRDTLIAGVIAGAISVAKSLLATQIGDKNSAATLPSPPDYTAPVPNNNLGI